MAASGIIAQFNERQIADNLGAFNPRVFVYADSYSGPSFNLFEDKNLIGTDGTVTTESAMPQTFTMAFGCINNDGTPINFTPYTLGFCSAGLGLTKNQQTQYYTAVLRLMRKWKRMD